MRTLVFIGREVELVVASHRAGEFALAGIPAAPRVGHHGRKADRVTGAVRLSGAVGNREGNKGIWNELFDWLIMIL